MTFIPTLTISCIVGVKNSVNSDEKLALEVKNKVDVSLDTLGVDTKYLEASI